MIILAKEVKDQSPNCSFNSFRSLWYSRTCTQGLIQNNTFILTENVLSNQHLRMQNELKLICSFYNFVLIGRHQPDKRMTNLGQTDSNIVNISKFKYCQYSQHITFKIQILSTYCQHSIFQSKKKGAGGY